MNETNSSKKPFSALGKKLKTMRVSRQESLAEVSGAVEIEVTDLEVIEKGADRPAEEILLLLITHFGIDEEEAEKLWELAGYTQNNTDPEPKPVVMVTPEDLKIVYTDMVHVSVNNYGVIMNFMQGGGPNSQPLAIARVGMSKEHAISMLELLQKTLAAQKQLPSQNKTKDSNK